MGRRTSGQTIGLQSIGQIQANGATLTTSQPNSNLTLDPNGAGAVMVNADIMLTGDISIANQGDLRLMETTGNGINYIAQHAAANMAGNYTITWPAAVSSTSGFFLASDTGGNLSWTSAAGNIPVSDPGSVATVHYPLFGTNAGALPSTLNPLARSNLSFIPSTGELSSPILSGSTSSASATLTIRGTSSGTKATASVLMPDNVLSTNTTTGTLVVTGGAGVSGDIHLGGTLIKTVTGTTTAELLRGNMADNDFFRILIGGTDTNAGYVEIATADDGTEPIHVRQYTGTFTSLTRTATLLNESGNTSFPGTVTANVLTATSDARLKENINTIDDALGKVLQLNGVQYNRIGQTSTEVGLVAQELEKIIPGLVTTGDDGMKSVMYGNIVGLLVQAIKEQQVQIDDLKNKVK